MLDHIKIGNQLAYLRKEKGLTGEKFAEALDVSPQAVSKWENGKCLPETALLPQIAELLGVSADILLNPVEGNAPLKSNEAQGLRFLGAWFGNGQSQRDVMHKMRHYDYFHWDEIRVNHETFPSSPGADGTESLTLIFLNQTGIHAVVCPEGESLCYSDDRTELFLKNNARCILPGIPLLEWEKGMDCCWAGAAVLALQYMGEPYTYEQIMGLSGACYRLNFANVWDWSATDALVAFDYVTPLMNAIGYKNVFCERLEKNERPAERQRIVDDLRRGRPVIAINLRIAAEWGVITGYADSGKTFYCRTYFDKDYLNENKDYLEADNWPFLIQHFGEKKEKPNDKENLKASLETFIASFNAPCERGYFQGKEAYTLWALGLCNEKLWRKSLKNKKEEIRRRLGVNESMLMNLIDARHSAAVYLRENAALLPGADGLAAGFEEIYGRLRDFREKLRNYENGHNVPPDEIYLCDEGKIRFINNSGLRNEESDLLEWAMKKEAGLVSLASKIVKINSID